MTKFSAIICCSVLAACGTTAIPPSPSHISEKLQPTNTIPELVQQSPTIHAPKPTPKVETYSVTVYKVPVQSLLFALARDAKLNVDIHPDIEGEVTLNALDQTLPQLLTRIAKQVDMRYELDGPNLIVLPDTAFLRNYKIDYVNISRNTTGKVSIATQIGTTGGGTGGGEGNNNSTTSVSNISNNHFWEVLEKNIKDILKETDKLVIKSRSESTNDRQSQKDDQAGNKSGTAPTAGSAGNPSQQGGATQQTSSNQQVSETERAASVIVNAETGLVAIRATSRQHDKIQEFLDLIMSSAKRQVLIEATIVEVQLNDQYQQGINWSRVSNSRSSGPSLTQGQIGTNSLPSNVVPGTTPGMFLLNYLKPMSGIGDITATIQLLESFGKVKVLSSPKISVLNNQTALLKVVDNRVYFTINATITPATATAAEIRTYSSSLNTVPVGFVMSVTPQIADSDEVTLNVRPSISRIIGYVQDPNPVLAAASVVSNVPVIQSREMESILKVSSGQIAVMGGLMQDTVDNLKDAVPGLNKIPLVGDAFAYRNETSTKTELVIFMRPVVVKDASISGDYKNFRYLLPDETPLNKQPYSETAPSPKPGKTKAAGS